jgi:Protein of unknown function (DUF632)
LYKLDIRNLCFFYRSKTVSCKMASAMTPLSLSTVDDLFNWEENKKVSSGRGLCLTLQKLYIWEKKLYNEVKVCL